MKESGEMEKIAERGIGNIKSNASIDKYPETNYETPYSLNQKILNLKEEIEELGERIVAKEISENAYKGTTFSGYVNGVPATEQEIEDRREKIKNLETKREDLVSKIRHEENIKAKNWLQKTAMFLGILVSSFVSDKEANTQKTSEKKEKYKIEMSKTK